MKVWVIVDEEQNVYVFDSREKAIQYVKDDCEFWHKFNGLHFKYEQLHQWDARGTWVFQVDATHRDEGRIVFALHEEEVK